MKILIVDDSAVQRKMIASIIRKAGFDNEILEASDGKEAIQVIGKNYKDIGLVLCDWNMPNWSGLDVIAGIAKVPQVANVPIIMVTSEGTEASINKAYETNPQLAGYIVKPFTPEQLKEKIEGFLNKD